MNLYCQVHLERPLNVAVDGNMIACAVALVSDLALEGFARNTLREDERVEAPSDALGPAEASPSVESVMADSVWMLLPPHVDQGL